MQEFSGKLPPDRRRNGPKGPAADCGSYGRAVKTRGFGAALLFLLTFAGHLLPWQAFNLYRDDKGDLPHGNPPPPFHVVTTFQPRDDASASSRTARRFASKPLAHRFPRSRSLTPPTRSVEPLRSHAEAWEREDDLTALSRRNTKTYRDAEGKAGRCAGWDGSRRRGPGGSAIGTGRSLPGRRRSGATDRPRRARRARTVGRRRKWPLRW